MNREEINERARIEARKRINAANIPALKAKAAMHRDRVAFDHGQVDGRRWENEDDPCTELLLTALEEMAQATKIETYLDMLRSENHPMWVCIEIDKERKANRVSEVKERVRAEFIFDLKMGYKGKECNTMIHTGTLKLAKLTFK